MPDIDIDLRSDFDPIQYFQDAVRASMVKDNQLIKHPAGVYFQPIPIDKITGLAAIPYEQADQVGFFKIDFLHLTLLDWFENKNEIRTLLKIEPDWNLLQKPENVAKLFQISKHFELISQIKPRSVQELGDCIALIRPGKRNLAQAYVKNRELIRKELYRKPEEGYYFKKGHAISYALNIVLQLHLLKANII